MNAPILFIQKLFPKGKPENMSMWGTEKVYIVLHGM